MYAFHVINMLVDLASPPRRKLLFFILLEILFPDISSITHPFENASHLPGLVWFIQFCYYSLLHHTALIVIDDRLEPMRNIKQRLVPKAPLYCSLDLLVPLHLH